jgi:WD40 repeat protein
MNPVPARRSLVLLLLFAQVISACSFRFPTLPQQPTTTGTATPTTIPSATPTPPPPRPSNTPAPTPSPVPPPTPIPTTQFLALAGTALPQPLPVIVYDNAGAVSALASWKESSFAGLAWAPDSTTLAVAGDAEIGLYDAYTRSRIRTLETDPGITSIAYSPQGDLIACANQLGSEAEGFSGNIDFWRVGDWRRIDMLYSPSRAVSQVAFSRQKNLLAAALSSPISRDNNIYFWNTVSFEITRTLTTGTVLDAVFSPDGNLIATTPDRYAIRLWQIRDGKLLHSLPTSFTGAVNSLAFSPDGKTLATGHYDGMIRQWDVGKGTLILEIKATGVVGSLAYTPDGSLLASAESYEATVVRLWDPLSGALLRTLDGHPVGVVELAFSPDGRLLASGSYDGSVYLWGVRP